MILPGGNSLLNSSWSSNLTYLRLQGELVVWSAWSLSDSWDSWTAEFITERTTRRQRPDLSSDILAASDSSYPVLFLVLCSTVCVLVLVLLCVCLSCWLARRKWRRENLNLNLRDQFHFHWNVVDHRNEALLVR